MEKQVSQNLFIYLPDGMASHFRRLEVWGCVAVRAAQLVMLYKNCTFASLIPLSCLFTGCILMNINATWTTQLQDGQQGMELNVPNNTSLCMLMTLICWQANLNIILKKAETVLYVNEDIG
jgi:hypothetical protein